jgi:STE24 endopeptidase
MATNFDPAKAADVFIAAMSPAAQQKAIAYTHMTHWMLLWGFLAGVVVALIILWSGVPRRLRDSLEKNGPRPWLVSLVVSFVVILMGSILSLPWDIYRNWWVEKSYGMTSQPLSGWMADHAKSELLGLIGLTLFLMVFYFLVRRAKGSWPIWGGMLVAAFAGLFLIIAPIYIEPLFNKYTPAPPGPMRDAVVTLAKQTGVPSDKIFIYNGSKQSNRYTANVSGLGGSARVAMSDVMFAKGADVAEVRGVVGHEMGHYMRGHVFALTGAFALLFMVIFFLVNLLFPLVCRLMGARGVKGIADPAGLPVLNVTLGLVMLLATPAMSSITRITEADADNYSLEHAHEPDGMSKALVKTADYRAPQPGRLEEIVFYDHPSVYHRVLNAMQWKAAHMDLAEKTAAEDAATQKLVEAQAPAPAATPAKAPPAPEK